MKTNYLVSQSLKACVSIKFRSHRVGPTNQLTPNICLASFYHFQRMTVDLPFAIVFLPVPLSSQHSRALYRFGPVSNDPAVAD